MLIIKPGTLDDLQTMISAFQVPVRKERKSSKKNDISPVNYSTSTPHDDTTASSPPPALPDSTTTSALEAFIDGVIDDNNNNNNSNNNDNNNYNNSGDLEVHEVADPEDAFIDVEVGMGYITLKIRNLSIKIRF